MSNFSINVTSGDGLSATVVSLCGTTGPVIEGGSADHNQAQARTPKLVSTLPLDDPEFREIVEEFIQLLRDRLGEMRQAWQGRDFDTLARLAHWLKGAGGTAGFAAFTQPAHRLEQLAKQHDGEGIPAALADLGRLTHTVVMPPRA